MDHAPVKNLHTTTPTPSLHSAHRPTSSLQANIRPIQIPDHLIIHPCSQISTEAYQRKEQARSLRSVFSLDKYKEMVEIGKELLKKMPTVITSVSGRKTEGILYKYVDNYNICILCVCHAKFLSPKEFIIHAGGDDVHNPLMHISVFPTLQ